VRVCPAASRHLQCTPPFNTHTHTHNHTHAHTHTITHAHIHTHTHTHTHTHAGASLLAAPFIAQSLLADSPGGSFSALLVGFALSEAWRAPGAIMVRSVAPQELGSTASALYLCIR
jgi:hypothetical protein